MRNHVRSVLKVLSSVTIVYLMLVAVVIVSFLNEQPLQKDLSQSKSLQQPNILISSNAGLSGTSPDSSQNSDSSGGGGGSNSDNLGSTPGSLGGSLPDPRDDNDDDDSFNPGSSPGVSPSNDFSQDPGQYYSQGDSEPDLCAPTPNFKVAFIGDTGSSSSGGGNFTKVLNLTRDEEADMLLIMGDLGYSPGDRERPWKWERHINITLGKNFPAFFSLGNHDAENNSRNGPNQCAYFNWNQTVQNDGFKGYREILQERFDRNNIVPNGNDIELGAKTSFTFNNIFVVLTALNQFGEDPCNQTCDFCGGTDAEKGSFLDQQMNQSNSLWKIAAWHRVRTQLQTGDYSGSSTMEPVYESARKQGAIIATAHWHTYSRTHALNNLITPNVADNIDPVSIFPEDDTRKGQTIVFHSGLGGESIRKQLRCGPTTPPYGCNGEWASIYSNNQSANYGALFIEFNVDTDNDGITEPRMAKGYFKAINGTTPDNFTLYNNASGNVVDCQVTCGTITKNTKLTQNITTNGTCFTIAASNIVLNGGEHTITGNGTGFGVINNGYTNVTIKNFAGISNFETGIQLESVSSSSIYNNVLQNNKAYGFFTNFSDHNNITLNTAQHNGQYGFYFINRSSYNHLEANTAFNNSNYGGFLLIYDSNHNRLISNKAYDNSANDAGIFLQLNFNNTLINNAVYNSGWGILLSYSSNNTLINNTVYGINPHEAVKVVYESHYNNLSSNTIHDSSYGLVLDGGYGGVMHTSADHNTVYDNTFYDFFISTNVNHSLLNSNVISASKANEYGIYLKGSSHDNSLINNNITSLQSWEILDHTGADVLNSILYTNNFGEIIWLYNGTGSFPDNLTLDVNNDRGLGLGRNLFIGDNIASLNTSAFSPQTINSSANITLKGLPFSSVNQIIKDPEYRTNSADVSGSDCLGSSCEKISYSGGTLIFNTTGFSSFKAQGT